MKLFIDSSTNYLYLALIKDGKCVCFSRSGKCDHSETLATFLKDFLNNQNIKPTDVKEVYIGRGPGSYTGLRIAGTIGKVYAFVNEIKLFSFSSLDLLLCNNIDKDGQYLAVTAAKKTASYAKAIKVTNGKIETILDESFIENDELVKYQDYQKIEVSDEFFKDNTVLAENILKNHLYKEESPMDYVPNYLRSVI